MKIKKILTSTTVKMIKKMMKQFKLKTNLFNDFYFGI